MTDLMRLDQELARKAAQSLQDTVDPVLRSRMRSLPVMIQTSGLAATAAFLLSRAERKNADDAYWRTADLILTDAAGAAGIAVTPGRPEEALALVAGAIPAKYEVAEHRARQLAVWLSRLAQALAERDRSTSDRDESGQAGS